MKHGLSEEIYIKIKKIIENNQKAKFILFGSRARGDYKQTSDMRCAYESRALGSRTGPEALPSAHSASRLATKNHGFVLQGKAQCLGGAIFLPF